MVSLPWRQVSCQQHAKLLRSGKEEDRAKAKAVELLMEMHPALKVAMIHDTQFDWWIGCFVVRWFDLIGCCRFFVFFVH